MLQRFTAWSVMSVLSVDVQVVSPVGLPNRDCVTSCGYTRTDRILEPRQKSIERHGRGADESGGEIIGAETKFIDATNCSLM